MIRTVHSQSVGISAIGIHVPPWTLGNDWFAEMLPRKFVQHTGILSRHIAVEHEVAMGLRAVENLRREIACDMRDCAAVVFVSPSLVQPASKQTCPEERVGDADSPARAARTFVCRLDCPKVPCYGINWGCSGYSKALSIIQRHIMPALLLGAEQFLLVATACRISRITDYSCKQTAPLFGDLATATILSPIGSRKYPVHFELLYAAAEPQATDRVLFDYHVRENVVGPTTEGGRCSALRRLVFSLDGLGIGDAAPRAMAAATVDALRKARIPPDQVRFVLPHQAGTSIVRFAAMKLEQAGIGGELINGLTGDVGNVSSCSIPYGLRRTWDRLEGTIVCPTAGVGKPGSAHISQGCIILRATNAHCAPDRPAIGQQPAAAASWRGSSVCLNRNVTQLPT